MFFSLRPFPLNGFRRPAGGRLLGLSWGCSAWLVLLFVVKAGRLEGVGVSVPNSTGIEQVDGILDVGQNTVLPTLLIIVLAAPASVLVRFWHARGEERQQRKRFANAAGC